MEETKIEFTRLEADNYCTPIGINEEGHVIYQVDMDKGEYWTRVDKEDKMFSYKIVKIIRS